MHATPSPVGDGNCLGSLHAVCVRRDGAQRISPRNRACETCVTLWRCSALVPQSACGNTRLPRKQRSRPPIRRRNGWVRAAAPPS
jgi:hypothetical protein